MEGKEIEEEKNQKKKKVVMVAIDDSECSRYALDWCLQHLRDSLVDSQLVIFTAQPVSNYSYIYASSIDAASPDLIRSVQENQQKTALALLEKAKDRCSKHGVAAETITENGDPKAAICEAVEKLHIELLVLGSHGRGAFKRAFLGSVSNYCIHHAKCSVLVVRKPV